MQVGQGYHISYCTNIHPGQDWEATFGALKQHVTHIRREVSPEDPFGLGLRLSDRASRELGLGNTLEGFRNWLQENDLYVFTMNGFPYGDFHGERVKDRVHEPDWTTPERLEYTRRLFRQLLRLMPGGTEAGISTSPVSYRHWHRSDSQKDAALRKGAGQMALVAVDLARMELETGNYLHLDIEPEPDGLLECTRDVLDFYRDYLLPAAIPLMEQELGLSSDTARSRVLRHITLCYDICHFALAFEPASHVLPALESEGIQVGKIQVSAALKIRPGNNREAVLEALRAFDEPIYLHQVTQKTADGVKTYPDLPDLFREDPAFSELRAHFHVPIFTREFGLLQATQDEILEVLAHLKQKPFTRHLEVETYTWDVLPKGLKEDLTTSITRELKWLLDALQQ